MFGPAVVIGGSLGGAVGIVAHEVWPSLVPEPGAFAMVGMAGFFASAAHVPISTVIMVSEMTGNYQLLVPTMFVCMLGFLLVRHHSIYEKQLPARASSPAHQRLIMRTMLERTKVSDVLALRPAAAPAPVTEATPLAAVLERFADGATTCLPVVNAAGALVGSIPFQSIRHTLSSRAALTPLVVAKDLAVPPLVIGAGKSLLEALRVMSSHDRSDLLVLDDRDEKATVVGVLTGSDINAIYDNQLVDIGGERQAASRRGLLARLFNARRPGGSDENG